MKKTIFLLFISISCNTKDSSQGEDFISKVDQTDLKNDSELLTFFERKRQSITPTFNSLPSGSTRPMGWIKELMTQDLENGIVGALDELYPGINSDDLYDKHRRGGLDDVPEMGDLVLTGADWETSIMWWNAETIGNWWDGFIRHAFLTENEKAINQSHEIVARLLASQDEDGYIGIYKPNLRYQHEGSNGELWAQTTAFRTLLGYYELTGKTEVLEAVEKGMQVTIDSYNEDNNPFDLKNAFGGVTHGLMITDVCETLHRITGEQIYQDYAVFLYKAFSTFSINRSFNDLRYPFLAQKEVPFTGHGVHTYEHFRTLLNAYYQTGYDELEEAYLNSLFKLSTCILPSGAGHGNEWLAGMAAHATNTSAEFCTLLELRNSLTSIVQKTGNMSFADHAEKLTYNGMMGFRNENGTAITYGKADNAFILDGHHHEHGTKRADPRYKYSPTHSDPAVCCVPNYTRNYTYFLDNMWLQKGDGFAAVLYGPSKFTGEINGTKISIEQQTNYPFSDSITFQITTEKPISFPIYLRKPSWIHKANVVSKESTIQEEKDFFVISKEWDSDEIKLAFQHKVEQVPFNSETYLQRGPLVYALPIAHKKEVIKSYENSQFEDYYALPLNQQYQSIRLEGPFEFKSTISNQYPWYNDQTYLKGAFIDTISKEVIEAKMIPIGSTVLRRVTFPIN